MGSIIMGDDPESLRLINLIDFAFPLVNYFIDKTSGSVSLTLMDPCNMLQLLLVFNLFIFNSYNKGDRDLVCIERKP